MSSIPEIEWRKGVNETHTFRRVTDRASLTPVAWPAGTYAAELRATTSPTSKVVAALTVDASNVADGVIVVSISNEANDAATATVGYFDLKRTTSGEPHAVEGTLTKVRFVEGPTA